MWVCSLDTEKVGWSLDYNVPATAQDHYRTNTERQTEARTRERERERERIVTVRQPHRVIRTETERQTETRTRRLGGGGRERAQILTFHQSHRITIER